VVVALIVLREAMWLPRGLSALVSSRIHLGTWPPKHVTSFRGIDLQLSLYRSCGTWTALRSGFPTLLTGFRLCIYPLSSRVSNGEGGRERRNEFPLAVLI
jgi:hypothetical protein